MVNFVDPFIILLFITPYGPFRNRSRLFENEMASDPSTGYEDLKKLFGF